MVSEVDGPPYTQVNQEMTSTSHYLIILQKSTKWRRYRYKWGHGALSCEMVIVNLEQERDGLCSQLNRTGGHKKWLDDILLQDI